MIPPWDNHFKKMTAWSLIYFLNYAYLEIWHSKLFLFTLYLERASVILISYSKSPGKISHEKIWYVFFDLRTLENKSFDPVYLIDTVIRLNQNFTCLKLTYSWFALTFSQVMSSPSLLALHLQLETVFVGHFSPSPWTFFRPFRVTPALERKGEESVGAEELRITWL